MWTICIVKREFKFVLTCLKLPQRISQFSFWYAGLQWAALTVDGEIISHSHAANWVADPTLEGAVVGAVNRLKEHCLVVNGQPDPVTRMERPAIFHPHLCADGAGGLAAEVGGAFIFYQDGCGAADGGFSYQCWQNIEHRLIKKKWTHWHKQNTKLQVVIHSLYFSADQIIFEPCKNLFYFVNFQTEIFLTCVIFSY